MLSKSLAKHVPLKPAKLAEIFSILKHPDLQTLKMSCNRITNPPTCRELNPPCQECRIAHQEQENVRLQMLSNIADAVLEATHREKEATKRALADKTAEAAAYRAARDQRDGNPTP